MIRSSQLFISGAWGSRGKLAAEAGPRGKCAMPSSLARRDKEGPEEANSANRVVTTRQVHVVTGQVQGQAQHIYSIAYVQYSSGKVKGGRRFREREHEMCVFVRG